MLVILGEMVDDAALLRVEVAAAEVLGADLLARRRLHQRRAAEEDRALVADDHALVAHRGHVGAAGGAAAHHAGDLGDALRAHLRLVEEDAAEMVAVGEDLGLVRQVGAAAVDQIDARQPVLLGDLLRAQVLLDGQRIVSAAFDRRVVADDHHLPARDAADAGDDARRRALRPRTCRRRRAGRSRGTASPDRAAARRGRAGSSLPRDDMALAMLFSVPPLAASATSARSFSASARLCAARARNSSLSVTILLSMRGALMPLVSPLVEKPCRSPSRCVQALAKPLLEGSKR